MDAQDDEALRLSDKLHIAAAGAEAGGHDGMAAMLRGWVADAEQLEGAVEDRAVLQQMVEDIANQIAAEGMRGWAADIRDEMHRLGVGGRQA